MDLSGGMIILFSVIAAAIFGGVSYLVETEKIHLSPLLWQISIAAAFAVFIGFLYLCIPRNSLLFASPLVRLVEQGDIFSRAASFVLGVCALIAGVSALVVWFTAWRDIIAAGNTNRGRPPAGGTQVGHLRKGARTWDSEE